jgi:hypothetical protein
MPSADFCPAVRSPLSSLSHVAATQDRPPGVIPAAFLAQSPDLRFPSLMIMDFAMHGLLVPRWRRLSGWVEDLHFLAAGPTQHTVPCSHSCEHKAGRKRRSHECERGTLRSVRHVGVFKGALHETCRHAPSRPPCFRDGNLVAPAGPGDHKARPRSSRTSRSNRRGPTHPLLAVDQRRTE